MDLRGQPRVHRVSIPRRGNEDQGDAAWWHVETPTFQSLVGAMRTGGPAQVDTEGERVSIPRRGNEDIQIRTGTRPATAKFQSLVGAMRTHHVYEQALEVMGVSIPRRGNEDPAHVDPVRREQPVSIPRRGNEDPTAKLQVRHGTWGC